MDDFPVVHQAIGVLMEALGVSSETATRLVIDRALQLGIPVAELSQQMVDNDNAQHAEELLRDEALPQRLVADD